MALTSIITVAEVGVLAAAAAMRLGVSATVWTGADPADQAAALQAATADLYAEPGLQLYDRETDSAVQLACTIQALYLLDLQADPGAQERRRLQDGGVSDIQVGKTRESYHPRRSGLCRAARAVLSGYKGTVSMA